MNRFFLPPPDASIRPEFTDAEGAEVWLARQPQANLQAMLPALATALQQLNRVALPVRHRYRILELLRRPALALQGEALKRCEFRPLPLAPAEQVIRDGLCLLWREFACAYLHCVQAALNGDPDIASRRTKVAHRALTALRLEQIACLAGGLEPAVDLWPRLHDCFRAASQFGAVEDLIEDPGPGETRESSCRAHYAMALTLPLLRPESLSRAQFHSLLRWLARWREQLPIRMEAPAGSPPRTLCVDLDGTQPFARHDHDAARPCWLEVEPILGKIKNRLKALKDGETPEALRLGNLLSADGCASLLQIAHQRLQQRPPAVPAAAAGSGTLHAVRGIAMIYRLLGGHPLEADRPPSAVSNRRAQEQIAIFGRVLDHGAGELGPLGPITEHWRLHGEQHDELIISRAGPGERLTTRDLLALRHEQGGPVTLAVVRTLQQRQDGSLLASVRRLPGNTQATVASARERGSNRLQLLPALLLCGSEERLALIPNGTSAKAAVLTIDERVCGPVSERSNDYELVRLGPVTSAS